ncbi:T9SS type A sorting domain-containing protein [Rubrivirga sp. IMCC43871]|uniref:T9SS type A sorting domain-containing protein n=1 Tax=Rubrivirga sp. IMCC43871 TaxID=3391575 RepID=UPI0039902ABB
MNALYPTNSRLTVLLVGLFALFGATAPAQAQADCDTGSAEVDLNVNNVRATLYNIGGLFWRGAGAQYEVPAGSGLVSIFASGIWLGGQVDGQLRFAGSTYGAWEYWPGPLDANGQVTSATCQQFDRFWKVNADDITAYNNTGVATSNLQTWPVAYGAPFFVDENGNGRRDPNSVDENGNELEPRQELDINDAGYGSRQLDLAAGERPDIIGDQGIWWVMNDAGNSHDWGGTAPIGVEVRAQAFAFSTADALNDATFYRYQFFYRGSQPMTDTYIGIFSDPDLGNFNDDFVGSDESLGLGFVYNGDNDDDGGGGYGLPPALGYDFFQGPLVNADGIDNDEDGETDEDDERLAIEKFFYFQNISGVVGDPGNANEAYSFMQGFWKDGTPLKEGGDGYNTNGPPVDFAFPGNPPEFWSEYNSDGNGAVNTPADRRFGVSSGPFTFNPGEMQEVVFGIVWAQATGATTSPQLASVNKLKVADATLQNAFDAQFALPQPPPAVALSATGLDQEIILEWGSSTGDLGDIFNYDVENPFVPVNEADRTYTFEGFRIYQFRDASDTEGVLIGAYDLDNGITTITDAIVDPLTGAQLTTVVANGSDNGGSTLTPTTFSINNSAFTQQKLRNGTSYFFGVQAYAYNEASIGTRVFNAPMATVEVRPSKVGPVAPVATTGAALASTVAATNVGQGIVGARVSNPGAVTGDAYAVEFFQQLDADGEIVGTSYRIVNQTTGTVLFDGAAYYADFGTLPPQSTDAFRADGLIFDVQGPENGFTSFEATANAAGPISPAESAAAAFQGFPTPGGANPTSGVQQTSGIRWLITTGNASAYTGPYEEFLQRVVFGRNGTIPFVFPFDFEARFTGTSTAYQRFGDGSLVTIPFEIWNTGIGTPDDTSDDFRMIPAILDIDGDGTYNLSAADSPVSSGADDPITDWIYWYEPNDKTPGESGYLAWEANAATAPDDHGHESLARTVFAGWNLGTAPPYAAQYPEAGSVFRITTTKPNQPGDVFTLDTSEIGAIDTEAASAEDQEAALDLMAITPNPYRGYSGYETSGNVSVARFVNIPAQATIRIFTLSGTLIRTIEKNNAGRATIDWNLRTEAGLPVASGMYLIHIEGRRSDGSTIGERVLKFGVIQRRSQLDVL